MDLNIMEHDKFFDKKPKNKGETNFNGRDRFFNLENESRSKNNNIEGGEREIKSILNSGFIVKNDEDFLLNTYGYIDKNIKENYNNIFLKDNYIEVQGASFQSMTAYGRNTTIKNIIMSKDKFIEINLKRQAVNFKTDDNLNNEFKLSDLTLKNYFLLKQNNINIDPENISPGIIIIKHHNYYKKVEYNMIETPSEYNFRSGIERDADSQKPALGILRNHRKTTDGFKNVKVSIDGKGVIEMESIHNWQKIKDYIKTRDISNLKLDNENGDRIEVHHITQLQDGGKDNVKNYVALSENTHKLVDSYKLLLDKNSSIYREIFNSKILEEKNAGNVINNMEGLDLNDKLFFNSLRLETESNSALRLTVLINKPDKIKMLFIDQKTGEEFRLVSEKIQTDNDEDKHIIKAALNNFIKELPTSI